MTHSMTYSTIVAGMLAAALASTAALGQTMQGKPSDDAPAVSTYKDAVEKTRKNTATRQQPASQVAVLHLMLNAEEGKLRRARVERMVVANAVPPKVFARSRGTWEVRLQGEQQAAYRIRNPLEDVEIENPSDAKSPYSQVKPSGDVPFDIVVPLSRAGRSLGVERIQIVDTETGETVVDTPVRNKQDVNRRR